MINAFLRAAVPLVCALPSIVAADSADDLRLGIDRGVGIHSDFHLHGGGTESDARTTGQPMRYTGAWVHRFAAETDSGPLAGISTFYQTGPTGLDGPVASSDYDLHTTEYGFDLVGGYAFVLPHQPRVRIEGSLFAGYFLQQLKLHTTGSQVPLGTQGWDVGASLGGFYTCTSRCDLGIDVRYLIRSDSEARYGEGHAKLETRGLMLGVSIGYRL